jgi:hypothetical protein
VGDESENQSGEEGREKVTGTHLIKMNGRSILMTPTKKPHDCDFLQA